MKEATTCLEKEVGEMRERLISREGVTKIADLMEEDKWCVRKSKCFPGV